MQKNENYINLKKSEHIRGELNSEPEKISEKGIPFYFRTRPLSPAPLSPDSEHYCPMSVRCVLYAYSILKCPLCPLLDHAFYLIVSCALCVRLALSPAYIALCRLCTILLYCTYHILVYRSLELLSCDAIISLC